MRHIAVFCGSSLGVSDQFAEAARGVGRGLAMRGAVLVYGGGRAGLMGVLADAALGAGGRVIGVIPDFLAERELAHPGVTELVGTADMHTRKAHMASLADAFITLPGGLGTLDETVEILTWRMLGLHDKPIFVLDVQGSAAPLLAAVDLAITQGFAAPGVRGMVMRCDTVEALLAAAFGN